MRSDRVYVCQHCGDEFTCCDECAADAEAGNPPLYCDDLCVFAAEQGIDLSHPASNGPEPTTTPDTIGPAEMQKEHDG